MTIPVLALVDFQYLDRAVRAGEVCEMTPEAAVDHAHGRRVSLDALAVHLARRTPTEAPALPPLRRRYRRRDLVPES